jgi:hypothetical protein
MAWCEQNRVDYLFGLARNARLVAMIEQAYVLICALRRIGLADATTGTIRLKLLKVGALVRISSRRIRIATASACPAAED